MKSVCVFAKIENSNFLKQLAKNCNHPLGRTIIAGNDHTSHAVDIMLEALRRRWMAIARRGVLLRGRNVLPGRRGSIQLSSVSDRPRPSAVVGNPAVHRRAAFGLLSTNVFLSTKIDLIV